jgi:hypothetical protein
LETFATSIRAEHPSLPAPFFEDGSRPFIDAHVADWIADPAVGLLLAIAQCPILEPENSIRNVFGTRIVRHDQDRATLVSHDVVQHHQHLLPMVRVEIPRRLVGQDDDRVVDESSRHRDPLLLPSGKVSWQEAAARVEPETIEKRAGSIARRARSPSAARRQGRPRSPRP